VDLVFEERYPHPIKRVWRALTTSDELERWLMRNDFRPEVGRRCVFRFCAADGGPESLVHVTVLALEPPRFMKWAWRGDDEDEETTVSFELSASAGGTTLRLHHTGTAPDDLVERLRSGWPAKLGALAETLGE